MRSESHALRLRDMAFGRTTGRKAAMVSEEPDGALRVRAQELQVRNDELHAYAHTVAHNLKDPLSVIMATSDAIFHISDLTAEELRAYLMQIHSTAQAMDDMIDNILLLSELGEAEVPTAAVDMDEILSRVRMRLSHLIEQHRARISHPGEWPGVLGYAPWIEEVWANFISNAIKYGGRPPLVDLGSTVRPDGTVLFWVRDNGAGLSLQAQKSIFEPFVQLGPVRTPGHGLGLSIAKRTVEKLGGEVGLSSQLGRGSLFYFTLPGVP